MEFICIIAVAAVIAVTLLLVFNANPKKSKEIASNEELDNLAEKYPSNLQICKDILKKLNNENVKIEEDKEAKECLYIAISNKIVIAGTQNNFTRIQTIAHECLHSVQSRRIQLFNFAFSNIYLLYFVVVLILGVLKIIPSELQMMFLSIYVLLGLLYFVVRAYLENDAMIKAKYLAKEYMEEQGACTKEDIQKLVYGFEQINNIGIKGYNLSLMLGVLVKTIILVIVFILF